MKRLENKCAIVTGGASGIGKATALLLAQEGAAVVIADIKEEQGRQTENEINSAGGRAVFVSCNVAKAEDCERVVRTAVNTFGQLDIVFNNAGIIRRTNVTDIAQEDWDLVMAINVKSIFLMCKYAVPHSVSKPGIPPGRPPAIMTRTSPCPAPRISGGPSAGARPPP